MRRLLPVLLLVSCSNTPDGPDPKFPASFLWGAAVAGFQVDMGCPTVAADECEDPASDWYQWVTDERLLEKKDDLFFFGGPPSTGPGFYELYPQDLARAKDELSLKSVRVSIEWSRVFPTSTESVADDYEALKAVASGKGVAFYHRLFAEMKAKGLAPLVTINHYTLPLWLHDGAECHFDFANCTKRGWLDDRTVTEARKYAHFVGREFGAEVDWWATLNEPLANTLAGYLSPGHDRVHPPGLSFKAAAAKTVTINMIYGHAAMYDGLKQGDTVDADGDSKSALIGLVYNIAAMRPADPDDPDDETAVKNVHYLYNELFLNATVQGILDEDAAGEAAGVKKAELEGRMDYLGINYYTRITVDGTVESVLPEFSPLLTLNTFTSVFWEDYTKGLYDVVKWAHGKYKVPIVITESGYSKPNDPPALEKAMVESLTGLKRAIDEGADVRGFYWWTLTDNYEWNHGMEGDFRFGLYAVDTSVSAKTRTKRPAADVYKRIVTENQIPSDLATKHPLP